MPKSSIRQFLRSYGGLIAFVALLIAAVVAAKLLGFFELANRSELSAAIERVHAVPGIAVWFVLAYGLVAGIGLPATPLTLAGGAIFGTALGSALNWTGAMIGALLGHFLANRLGSAGLKRLLGKNSAKVESISKHLTFATLFRLRLIPVMPFNVLNVAAGLAKIPLRIYLPATALGILPGTIIYTFFADSLIGGVAGAQSHALVRISIAAALLIAISFAPSLVRRLRHGAATMILVLAAPVAMAGVTRATPVNAQSAATALMHSANRNAYLHAARQRVDLDALWSNNAAFDHSVFDHSAFDHSAFDHSAFDHSAFDQLLRKHVENGLVDYEAFERAPEFAKYLDALAQADPKSMQPSEQLAFWINAYNAYTIALINQHHERKSIRNINKSFGLISIKGPWTERMARVGGTTYTLLHIENEIIRKQFHDPRIHFAIVCASLGCPPLRSEAYTGAALEQQLDDQARTFILRSPTKNRIDLATRTVYVSPIFDWYEDDFRGSSSAVATYIAQYYPPGPERDLLLSGKFSRTNTEYDWSINIQSKARR